MKTIELVNAELRLLKRLLDELSEKYTCAGCNDFEIESTPEMNHMIAIAEKQWADEVGEDRFDLHINDKGVIMTSDFMVLEYFQRKFGIKED